VVVIFQENVSFDHYFGTYPHATNQDGQPFHGAGGAKINGLYNTPGLNGHGTLLTNNPNTDSMGNQVNPRRLDPANLNDVLLCDQDHDYNDEQKAFDGGKMDKYTQSFVGGAPQFNTANHNYDMSDFNSLVGAISHGFLSPDHLPAVSFLKAPGYQDGHAGYSDPYDEQQFVTSEINALEQMPDWSSTAVVVTYDDSDGFYDHVYSGIHNTSNTSGVANPPGPQDFLTGTGLCGDTTANPPLAGQSGRCGYGPRLPFLLISPWAKRGDVSNTLTDFSSIDKFVEDNWGLPRIPGSADSIAGSIDSMFDFHGHGNPALFLNPNTGQPAGPGGPQGPPGP
jgi:phospholipase C